MHLTPVKHVQETARNTLQRDLQRLCSGEIDSASRSKWQHMWRQSTCPTAYAADTGKTPKNHNKSVGPLSSLTQSLASGMPWVTCRYGITHDNPEKGSKRRTGFAAHTRCVVPCQQIRSARADEGHLFIFLSFSAKWRPQPESSRKPRLTSHDRLRQQTCSNNHAIQQPTLSTRQFRKKGYCTYCYLLPS